jgi:hypothetical protein
VRATEARWVAVTALDGDGTTLRTSRAIALERSAPRR